MTPDPVGLPDRDDFMPPLVDHDFASGDDFPSMPDDRQKGFDF